MDRMTKPKVMKRGERQVGVREIIREQCTADMLAKVRGQAYLV